MPELPEVAGLAGFLDEQLRGCVVTKLQVVSFAVLKTADPPFDALEGRTVSGALGSSSASIPAAFPWSSTWRARAGCASPTPPPTASFEWARASSQSGARSQGPTDRAAWI